jgi:hypothetical protein
MTRATCTVTAILTLTSCGGVALLHRWASADERAGAAAKGGPDQGGPKTGGLTLDVVLEDVDLAGNTLTARAYHHVIPPSGSAGGVVYSGHLPPGAKPARYERLPVMPKADLKNRTLRPGMRVTLRLEVTRGGAPVVTGAERNSEPERVGIDWLDAPATNGVR